MSHHGPSWQPPTVEQLDEWLDRYTVLKMIGRGGMGAVYLGRQPTLERDVAIKVLPVELSADAAFVRRFEREARAMARLDHPNIVRVFDFGRTSHGHPYFVMEYVDGCDLGTLIQRGGVEVAQALALVTQICDALAAAHAEGIVHRDIKPSNVLVDRRGRVKIADFGLARPVTLQDDRTLSLSLTQTGSVMGTLEYMAPEQLMGRPVDHRADIYALGVLFYELLTGDVPRGAWRPPSEVRPMDGELDKVVQRALQPKPEERYQQVAEVRRDVTTVVQRLHVPPMPGWRWKKPVAAAALALLLLGGGVAAWRNRPPASTVSNDLSPQVKKAEPKPEPPIAAAPNREKPKDAALPVAMAPSAAPVVGNSLLTGDFRSTGDWAGAVSVDADGVKIDVPADSVAGSVEWALAGEKAVDFSPQAAAHWQMEAKLGAENVAALLISLVDAEGRTRAWRVKAESFFADKFRTHAHPLPVSQADFQSATEGLGPVMETAGFDLGRVVAVRLQIDPAAPADLPVRWQIRRLWLPK